VDGAHICQGVRNVRVIKVHGCSGAGKTTAVRALMKRCSIVSPIPEPGAKGKPEAYMCSLPALAPIYVLGSYETTCGGMDTVGTAQEVMGLLDKYIPKGHVVFEGLLQSTYYGAMGLHSLQFKDRYIYAFLDTPIDLCLERVVKRRAASGITRPFNPQLTRNKHETILNLKRRLEVQNDHIIRTIRHDEDVGAQMEELLK
jgi:adenylate kinase family enzyme